MSLRILVIDDQIARSEEDQTLFLRSIGELTGYDLERRRLESFEVVFCSGQIARDGRVINDISVAVQAVGTGQDWALILLDMQFDSGSVRNTGGGNGRPGDALFGLEIERALLAQYSELPIVRFTSKPEQELGQADRPYLAKLNLAPDEFRYALLKHGRMELRQKWELLDVDTPTFIASPAMLDVYCRAMKLAGTDDPVLILGETGVGKEVLANYIHRHSGRAASPFIPVNVAAMPEHLADSELFGHERGAFTGADRLKKGYFEQTGRGTVFLDEIGDMPAEHQLRLLRVLQERQFRRVGGSVFIPFDGRVILATHRDLQARMREGLFREDLYNRLTLSLVVPPLRERREEIVPLAERFLAESAAELGKQGISLDISAHRQLLDYGFPGNVRELAALMKVVVIGAGNNRLIRADDLPLPRSAAVVVVVPEDPKAAVELQPARQAADVPARAKLNLSDIERIMRDFQVMPGDASLRGAKPRLEAALRELLLRCAGVSLEICRHQVKRRIKLLPAMQLF